MAKALSIDVSGIPEVKRFLKTKEKRVGIQLRKGLTMSAVFLQSEVKSSIAGRRAEKVSVDTGRFLNSVEFKVSQVDAEVSSPVPYAKFLEFGNSKFRGRRHFTNSKNRNKGKIINLIDKEIKSI